MKCTKIIKAALFQNIFGRFLLFQQKFVLFFISFQMFSDKNSCLSNHGIREAEPSNIKVGT